MLGFVPLGIPGTNHKGTGADHASSYHSCMCVPEPVLSYLPAPVVPPARWEESNDGD